MSETSNSTEHATPSVQHETGTLEARKRWMVNLVCAILNSADTRPAVGIKGEGK